MSGIKHATTGAGTKVSPTVWAEAHVCASDEAMLFKLKDTFTDIAADNNRSSSLAWTDVNCTSAASSDAKAVLVRINLVITTRGGSGYVWIKLRKNGTSEDAWDIPGLYVHRDVCADSTTFKTSEICALDTSQILEWAITISGAGWDVSTAMSVLGYWE